MPYTQRAPRATFNGRPVHKRRASYSNNNKRRGKVENIDPRRFIAAAAPRLEETAYQPTHRFSDSRRFALNYGTSRLGRVVAGSETSAAGR